MEREVKRVKKKVLCTLTLIVMVTLASFSLVAPVLGAVTVQEIKGKLGGADYLVRIPSNWNGRLVVYCRGYSHLLSGVDLVATANAFNAMINLGTAFAESSYGVGGFCIKEGIIRTHQLTEWVINNYHVTGRVYLVGISMGGATDLMIGAKYPEVYAGVLDIAGTTDAIARYDLHSYYADIADDTTLANAVLANGGLVPPFPCPTIAAFREYCQMSVDDTAAACGGTPEGRPQAYERVSPLYSATEIGVPTMVVHGTKDGLIPYSHSVNYYNAVVAAGHGSLIRFYKVVGGEHANLPVVSQIPVRLNQLIKWAENGILPPNSDTP